MWVSQLSVCTHIFMVYYICMIPNLSSDKEKICQISMLCNIQRPNFCLLSKLCHSVKSISFSLWTVGQLGLLNYSKGSVLLSKIWLMSSFVPLRTGWASFVCNCYTSQTTTFNFLQSICLRNWGSKVVRVTVLMVSPVRTCVGSHAQTCSFVSSHVFVHKRANWE